MASVKELIESKRKAEEGLRNLLAEKEAELDELRREIGLDSVVRRTGQRKPRSDRGKPRKRKS